MLTWHKKILQVHFLVGPGLRADVARKHHPQVSAQRRNDGNAVTISGSIVARPFVPDVAVSQREVGRAGTPIASRLVGILQGKNHLRIHQWQVETSERSMTP